MATWVVRVDMPPRGALEEGRGGGGELADEEMEEESRYRQEFLDYVSPRLAALLERGPRRSANAQRVELHGADTWSNLNHYLLMVTVDIGGPGFELDEVLPPEAEAAIIGDYAPLAAWPGSEER
ncbi:MAG TPA: hypothetical protein VHF27_08590 [Acidimicrobiales bacterium]|nr:hypothetical protein [Acidimicrobiales bacterium]